MNSVHQWDARLQAQIVHARSYQQLVQVPDFPTVEVLELGPDDGVPVFFLHGTPGSSIEAMGLAEAAALHGVRVIAPNRPGVGRSERWSGRTLSDEAEALGALADVLGIETFGVIGISGGGPRALAVARYQAHRTTFVWSLAGWGSTNTPAMRAHMAPLDRIFASLSLSMPWLLYLPLGFLGWAANRRSARWLQFFMNSYLSDADRREVQRSEFFALLQADVRIAYQQGTRAAVDDALLCFRPWSFEPAHIACPVHLVHGDDDVFVPLIFSQATHDAVACSTLEIVPGLGHYGLFNMLPELLVRALSPEIR